MSMLQGPAFRPAYLHLQREERGWCSRKQPHLSSTRVSTEPLHTVTLARGLSACRRHRQARFSASCAAGQASRRQRKDGVGREDLKASNTSLRSRALAHVVLAQEKLAAEVLLFHLSIIHDRDVAHACTNTPHACLHHMLACLTECAAHAQRTLSTRGSGTRCAVHWRAVKALDAGPQERRSCSRVRAGTPCGAPRLWRAHTMRYS